MSTNDTSAYPLTTLLSSTPFLLAYALPLLLLSIMLTFSGAFFILDRSRSFPPRYDAIPGAFNSPKKFKWLLEGGFGGLATGYTFGLHFSTFLALLVPTISTSAPLSSGAFTAVWLISCAVTTFLAGRWKYCALAFSGISGGALFSLSVSVIIHPSRITRIVLIAILTPILTILVLLPLRFQHASLRFASASTGAFGLVLTIALMSHIPAWANVWERLWLADGETWGTPKEKGLSAAFCIFLCMGMMCDWLLRRRFGECPDEKWDSYLATYAANLPNSADRAGTFQPPTSFWERFFNKAPHPSPGLTKDIVFPTNADMKSTPKLTSGADLAPPVFAFQRSPGFLKKGKSQSQTRLHALSNSRKPREAIKFRPGDGNLSSDSEDDDTLNSSSQDGSGSGKRRVRPWLLNQKASVTSATPTLVDEAQENGRAELVDYDTEIERLKKSHKIGDEIPDYSDYEEDLTSTSFQKNERDIWSPGFMKRQRSNDLISPMGALHPDISPPGAVPVTPSLIKALDRIAIAQKDAFGIPPENDGLPSVEKHSPLVENRYYKAPAWDGFWRDVSERAKK
ncbi:hypothetical protein BD779DRAFT_1667454 [Infundibulicybe gibba]|nr:hypothetical protein BD779DRAFT_1667454 [Infundibulicybe gibba]